MNTAEKESWQQVRAKGRGAFVLRHGVLKTGLVFGCFMALVSLLVSPSHTGYEVYIIAVKSAGMALAIGASVGARRWKTKEKEYEESKD